MKTPKTMGQLCKIKAKLKGSGTTYLDPVQHSRRRPLKKPKGSLKTQPRSRLKSSNKSRLNKLHPLSQMKLGKKTQS
jgi:hypothetical protein